MQKFVILSDLHLVPEGQTSHGIDTFPRLTKALAHIRTHHEDAAFVILDGDLADHAEIPAYERLKAAIADFPLPVHMTMGNHDDRAVFHKVFPDRPMNPATTQYDMGLDLGAYRVIILDSTEPGKTEGYLSTAQIAWLRDELTATSDKPVICVLHHNITDFTVPTDVIRLQNPAPLIDALKAHPDMRMVISGHVHMSTAGTVRGVPFTTIAGSHYNIFPKQSGPISEVPRLFGPGQMAVVMAGEESVVVHHENFLDQHEEQDLALFQWEPEDDA
ncbi:MAG: metallophosphoesterase [Mangrovicoccus sp.]